MNIPNLELAIKNAFEEATYRYLEILKKEMPEKKGTAKESTKITTLAAKINDGYKSEITIGKGYMWKIWKGSSENEAWHVHRNAHAMVFSDWPNGPDELRNAAGYFIFKRVRHKIPPNNFIERTTEKSEKVIIEIFNRKLKEVIK